MDRSNGLPATTKTDFSRFPDASWLWRPATERLSSLVAGFDLIDLKEMEAVALLNRTDTKFVMTTDQLLKVLAALQQDYRILSVGGQRLNHYRTLYFDTPRFDLYTKHVNGSTHRYKVRSREYTDSHRSFLEVKHKTGKQRTIKERIRTEQPVLKLGLDHEHWLQGVFPYDSRSLQPKLWNTFIRITLVSKRCCERVTLDTDLAFYADDHVVPLERLAVAEVKRDENREGSAFLALMHSQHIHPQGFSKYCLGISLLYDQVKKNAMKPRILKIEKMTQGAFINERAGRISA